MFWSGDTVGSTEWAHVPVGLYEAYKSGAREYEPQNANVILFENATSQKQKERNPTKPCVLSTAPHRPIRTFRDDAIPHPVRFSASTRATFTKLLEDLAMPQLKQATAFLLSPLCPSAGTPPLDRRVTTLISLADRTDSDRMANVAYSQNP